LTPQKKFEKKKQLLQKPGFLFTGEIAPKRQKLKMPKRSDFGFSHQEVRKKVSKNGQIYLLILAIT
jgi:hypothetical protein